MFVISIPSQTFWFVRAGIDLRVISSSGSTVIVPVTTASLQPAVLPVVLIV